MPSTKRAESEELLAVDGIGAVRFVRKRGVRRLSIRLRPLEPVRVLAPWHTTPHEATRFVHEKRAWIDRHRARITRLESRRLVFDEGTSFRTREHRLEIRRWSGESVRSRVGDGVVRIDVPVGVDVHSDAVQSSIRAVVERVYRREARRFLPGRVRELAASHGLRCGRITIRNQRTRWGSCSGRNDLSLNLHLMRLPDHLIDYVLLHELAHTVEKNHGPPFWRLLNALTGGRARALDHELKGHSLRVY